MFKRELKVNFKSFLIWTLIMLSIFLMIFLVYPSIASDAEAMKKLLELFPPEMLAMFNMDIAGLETFYGWCASEGQMFIGIMGGCFAAILGSTIVLKERNDKTVEFLWSKPISKNKILTSKLLSGLLYVVLFDIIVFLTTQLMFSINNEGSFTNWALIMLGTLLGHISFYIIGLLISMLYTKTRKAMATGLGLVIGTYIISSISKMTSELEFLKYFSPFSYIEPRAILTNGYYDTMNIIILFSAIIIFTGLSYFIYNKQEI